jgi:tetratricopeptide (TPR) repeat protein
VETRRRAFFVFGGSAESCEPAQEMTMGRVLSAAIAMLVSTAGFPQSDDWGEQMAEGAAAEAAGDYPRAASLYRIATEIAERFELQDKRRALAWNATAMMYDTIGQYAEAGAAYRRALKEAAESTGKTGPEYALVLANMGAWYVETGQAAAGEELVRKSLKIYLAPRSTGRVPHCRHPEWPGRNPMLNA